MSAIHAIGAVPLFSTSPYAGGEIVENIYSSIPIYAGVGDADAFLQTSWAFCRHLLVAFVDV